MACERCKDPNKTDTHEYTITKITAFTGAEDKRKQVLCDECAEITRSMHKVTGGKREAEPEASTEVAEKESAEPTAEPTAARPSRRRGQGPFER